MKQKAKSKTGKANQKQTRNVVPLYGVFFVEKKIKNRKGKKKQKKKSETKIWASLLHGMEQSIKGV